MNESRIKLEQYAKEQEKLFLEYVSVHQKLDEFIQGLNHEVEQYINNGNQFQREIFGMKREIVGNGYFEDTPPTPHYFRDHASQVMEAHELFRNRITNKYMDLYGKIEIFSPLELGFDKARSHQYYLADDILQWLEDEKNGITIQKYFSRYEFHLNKKTVSYQDDKWDKSEYDDNRVYPPYRFEKLFGGLHYTEFGNTNFKDVYNAIYRDLDCMTRDEMKKPFSVEESKVVESIRFYQNGKVDIRFVKEDLAKKFVDFVTAYSNMERAI